MIGQLTRFAGVGAIATVVHVIVAMLASNGLGWEPQSSNLIGFAAAVMFSYLGHSQITFGTTLEHRTRAPRFVVTACLGLLVSSLLTQVIAVWMGAPFTLAIAIIAVAVPVSSFLMYKFWVFPTHQPEGP